MLFFCVLTPLNACIILSIYHRAMCSLVYYLAYALSLRNLEEMMARGIIVDHFTLHRWVIRLVPLLDKVFHRHKRAVGHRWRMDETYIKIKGQWKYLYRAVDTSGQTIDFLLTRFRRLAFHGGSEVVASIKAGLVKLMPQVNSKDGAKADVELTDRSRDCREFDGNSFSDRDGGRLLPYWASD